MPTIQRALAAAALALLAFAAPATGQPAKKGAGTTDHTGSAPAPAAEGERADRETTPPAEARVDGFRSAAFGMSEAQVRDAIRKDFNLAKDKVAAEESPTDRTLSLSVTVNDLLPEAGPARINYVFGYKSKKLMQVHVVWGGGQTPAVKPEKLQLAAATLQQYFLGEGFPQDKMVTNGRTPDGTVVVFQGFDSQKRLALLRYIGAEPGAKEKGEKTAAPPPTLWLSYVQDLQNPDVYRIPKGQF